MDSLLKALEDIRDTAKSWEGRKEAPYWDLGYKAAAALKKHRGGVTVDEFDLNIIKDFIGENWSAFETRCEEAGRDPEELYQELKKEADGRG